MDSREIRSSIIKALRISYKGRGRILTRPIPELALQRGNRLEPSTHLPDVFKFEKMSLPFNCVFWLGNKDDRLTHVSPLLTDIEGVNTSTYGPAILHSWDLGPLSAIVATCFHLWLRTKLWSTGASGILVDDDKALALVRIKSELQQYYKDLRRTDSSWAKKGSEAFWSHNIFVLVWHLYK